MEPDGGPHRPPSHREPHIHSGQVPAIVRNNWFHGNSGKTVICVLTRCFWLTTLLLVSKSLPHQSVWSMSVRIVVQLLAVGAQSQLLVRQVLHTDSLFMTFIIFFFKMFTLILSICPHDHSVRTFVSIYCCTAFVNNPIFAFEHIFLLLQLCFTMCSLSVHPAAAKWVIADDKHINEHLNELAAT